MSLRAAFGSFLMLAALSLSVHAQWLKYPTAGIPRLPDGSPNLVAPAPRMPDGRLDLSGLWHVTRNNWQQNIAVDLAAEPPMLPGAAELYQERKRNEGRDHPRARCLPRSIPNAMVWSRGPIKVVHTPGVSFILFEEFVTFRQVFTDGRPFPSDLQPAWWGYSTGRWDQDSFLVQSVGFKDNGWLDFDGHPYSEALQVTERFRRVDFGHLTVEFTFDDPKTYTKPWSVTVPFELMPDTEFIENVCENERSYEHMVGK